MSEESSTEKDKLEYWWERWWAAILGASIGALIGALPILNVLNEGDLITAEFFIILIIPVSLSILIAAQIKNNVVSFLASLVLSWIGLQVVYYIVLFGMLIRCGVGGC